MQNLRVKTAGVALGAGLLLFASTGISASADNGTDEEPSELLLTHAAETGMIDPISIPYSLFDDAPDTLGSDPSPCSDVPVDGAICFGPTTLNIDVDALLGAESRESGTNVVSGGVQVLPLPAECVANGLNQQTMDRFSTCTIATGAATLWGSTGIVGQVDVMITGYVYTDVTTLGIIHQSSIFIAAQAGVPMVLDTEFVCGTTLGVYCPGTTSSLPATALSPGYLVTGADYEEAFYSDPPIPTPTSPDTVMTAYIYNFSSGTRTDALYSLGYSRCDSDIGGYSPGCVNPNFKPTIKFSTTAVPTYAAHVTAALASGLPGSVLTGPLHRTRDSSLIALNRSTACGSSPTVSGYTCDEYPFASTYEGAAAGGVARSFTGCSFSDPASTGPVGFSHCMILAGDNSLAGSILGNGYSQNRLLEGEAFFVGFY